MKKKIFIITGMILCILAGIVIVPSVIRTRQAVKEFEKDFHASANSGADSAGIDSEDEPAAENEEVSEEEEKNAFELDSFLDHRDMTHRLYIYDMDYIEKAISFEKKSLQDFSRKKLCTYKKFPFQISYKAFLMNRNFSICFAAYS